ncbi:MAG TPA: hypothetical protein VLF21_00030 [Candidatus Saccharimonadales bacterium]|nr:hypothetical protein [Candidatus Saccharimonadales bacterium]
MANKKAPEVPKTAAVIKREASANNYIALVSAMALVIVLVSGFIAKGLVNSIILNSQLILKQNQAKADLDKKLQDIPTLISNYKSLGDKQKLIIHALPTTPDFPQLVSITQAMSSNAGTQLKSVSPSVATAEAASGAPASSSGPSPFLYSAEINGSYSQIVQFFKNIELSARPMRVVSSDFSSADGVLKVTVVLSSYYQDKAKIDDETGTIK